ncbi:MAG: hypothetical protein D6683_06410 [Actinomyces sp.]|nr:MAG: hypothetical protein D6683_06410 [Actinomyces sp.]
MVRRGRPWPPCWASAWPPVWPLRLPRLVVATGPPAELEKAELRDPTIVLGALAMAVLRGIVGFVTFLVAFEFRGGKEGLDISAPGAALGGATATVRGIDIVGDPAAPAWHFGVVVAAAGLGAVTGARLAPALRSRLREESMLLGVLGALVGLAVFSAALGGLLGAVALALGVATAAGAGKLAFESLVQRDAPDANHGRSFARFEARFQIAWVIGAFVPAVLHLGAGVGAWMVAIASLVAVTLSLLGRQADRRLHASSVNRWLTGEATVSGAVLARLRRRWGAPGPGPAGAGMPAGQAVEPAAPGISSLPPPTRAGVGPAPTLPLGTDGWDPPTVPVGAEGGEAPTVPVGAGAWDHPAVPGEADGDRGGDAPGGGDEQGPGPSGTASPVAPTIWAGEGVEIDDEPG